MDFDMTKIRCTLSNRVSDPMTTNDHTPSEVLIYSKGTNTYLIYKYIHYIENLDCLDDDY